MEEKTVDRWVEQAQQGDRDAMANLFRQYWRAARAVAYGVTGEYALAEDAASEAFVTALSGIGELKDASRFGPWLRKITKRTAQRLKKNQTKQVDPPSRNRSHEESPGGNAERKELAALMQAAVGRLPASLREAVSFFYFEGYSVGEAARFLGVAPGTFKRRLHEGRQRLQQAAESIVQGRHLLDTRRETIIKQLRALTEQDADPEAMLDVMREAIQLRPPPFEAMRALWRKHHAPKIAARLQNPQERERLEALMRQSYRPSARSLDPSHPVGQVAAALRAALPAFQPWDVDAATILQRLAGQDVKERMAPGFAEGKPCSYIRATRGILAMMPDGSLADPMGMFKQQDRSQRPETMYLSDVVDLTWLRTENIELRAVDVLVRDLIRRVVPERKFLIKSYEHPRYRVGLRLTFDSVAIAGAYGGVHYPWPECPEGTYTAHVRIHLEPWAMALSGQTIEYEKLELPDWLGKPSTEGPSDT
ncbi:RNA polymerase sigma factor [Planctomycetota bacterium]